VAFIHQEECEKRSQQALYGTAGISAEAETNPLPTQSTEKESAHEAVDAHVKTDKGSPSARLFLHDVAITMGAEVASVASSLILTSMLSRWMGAQVLSEYLLLRRVLTWSISATLLGLATGLPRYVAHAAGYLEAAGKTDQDEPAYFLAAAFCMLPVAVAGGVLMILFRGFFAKWLFGNPQETGLVIALAVLICGFAIHRAVYGYYRGLLDMVRANLLEICNVAVLPMAVVLLLYRRQPIGVMMFETGGLMMVIAALFAIPILLRLRQRRPDGTIQRRCGELLRYGLPRVPGEFGATALTALGPILAAHFMEIDKVSPLLLGLNILMVTGYAAAPLGTVLLSKVSMMLGQNQHEELQSRLRLLLVAVMEVSIFTCIQLAVFADIVVRGWVGPAYLNQMGVIRLVLLAIPPYLFFVALRSPIDAASVKPFNTANVLISLTAFLGLIAAWMTLFPGHSMLVGIAGALLSSQILLALLTARTFRKFYGLAIPWRSLGPSLAAAVALGAVAFAYHQLRSDPIPLFEAMLVETALTLIYLLALAKRGSGWIAYTLNVGFRRRASWPTPAARTYPEAP